MQMLAGAIKLQTRVPGGSFGRNKGQQTGNYEGLRKLDKPDSNRTSPFCNYYKKTGHSIDKCYRLHGFPPNSSSLKEEKWLQLFSILQKVHMLPLIRSSAWWFLDCLRSSPTNL